MPWQQVDRDELLLHSGRDPFVRFATSSEIVALTAPFGWACVSPWRPGSAHWGGIAVVDQAASADAESQALAAIVDTVADEVGVEWFSTRPGRPLEVPEAYTGGESGRWAFMWTECPGAETGEGLAGHGLELVEMDDRADADLIEAFGRTHGSKPYLGFPGHGYASLWLAARDEVGQIVAVGALHELGSGMPHLAGIVVRPELRGQGIGTLMTQALTTRAVQEAGVATLGVLADNMGARSLYERLGYATAHQVHTRALVRVTQPAEPTMTG